MLKYLLPFQSTQVSEVNLKPHTAPRLSMTSLVKFVAGARDAIWQQWFMDITCRIILGELFPAVLGKVTKMTLSLFPLDNLSYANIERGTITPSQDQLEEKASRHKKAEPNELEENDAAPDSGKS